MKKTAISLIIALVMTLGIALAPTLTEAAEFSYAGPPAFTVTYPDGSEPTKPDADIQVWAIKTPEGVVFQASVASIPEGIELKDYAEKSFKPGIESRYKTKANVKKNEPITLADGTKAYYSETEWMWTDKTTLLTSLICAAYKDGKLVFTSAHPWMNVDDFADMVQSLKFK